MNEKMTSSESPEQAVNVIELYGIQNSKLLSGDKGLAEAETMPYPPHKPAYGALPYLKESETMKEHILDELEYFQKHYTPKEAGAPPWRDAVYAEGILMFEAKTDKHLSEFSESILAQYPVTEGKGKVISLFGLSGAGKSTSLEALKEVIGHEAIVMDSDTVRYNLFAKIMKDAEEKNGVPPEKFDTTIIHNRISGAMYLLLEYLTKELKTRGYTVIRSSTMPEKSADKVMYLEHPDGIEPEKLTEQEIAESAKTLYARTESRVKGDDDYDWGHAEIVTDFNAMKPVTVKVPEHVHAMFLKSIGGILNAEPGMVRVKNPNIGDPEKRLNHMKEAFSKILSS